VGGAEDDPIRRADALRYLDLVLAHEKQVLGDLHAMKSEHERQIATYEELIRSNRALRAGASVWRARAEGVELDVRANTVRHVSIGR
jgi:hypothetical protein